MGVLKTTKNHIRRSPYQVVAAILIITQTFIVVSIFSIIIFVSSNTIAHFESVPQVTAFFKNEATQENISALREQVKMTGKVAKTRFVSKQEALQIYKQQNKDDDPLLLDLVTADILPASLEVSALNIEDLSGIADTLKNSSYVQKVVYQKDIISTLKSWTDALRKIGIVLIAVLAIDSIFIMVIIIGIKISQKKDEIEVMRLLGATSWYIRWPFLLEGILYGIIGALVGWLVTMGTLWYATPYLSYFLRGIPVFPISPIYLVALLAVELALAVVLGIFASSLAVLRYLKK